MALLAACPRAMGEGTVGDYPPLVGKPRAAFVDSGMKTCRTTQRNAPENADISEQVQEEYCNCFMEVLANSVSNKELSGLNADAVTEVLKTRVQIAGNYCISMMRAKIRPVR